MSTIDIAEFREFLLRAKGQAERSRYGSFERYLALGGVTSDAADFGGLPG